MPNTSISQLNTDLSPDYSEANDEALSAFKIRLDNELKLVIANQNQVKKIREKLERELSNKLKELDKQDIQAKERLLADYASREMRAITAAAKYRENYLKQLSTQQKILDREAAIECLNLQLKNLNERKDAEIAAASEIMDADLEAIDKNMRQRKLYLIRRKMKN